MSYRQPSTQRGYIFKRKRSWYGRWRQDEIQNGNIVRVQRCEKLCDYSDRYRTKKDVQPLLDEKLQPLNAGTARPESTLSIREYTEKFFLPYAERELRPATYNGYKYTWKLYLRPHLEKITLRDFRCVDATNLLNKLHRSHGLGRTTLSHVKVLLSVIFKHAKTSGALDGANPVTDSAIPRAANPGRPTHAYTPQEIVLMLDSLEGTPKLAISVMFFCGLRPSEARGLKWSDYDPKTKTLSIARSMWRSFTTAPKTASSGATVPVPTVLADLLEATPRMSEYVLTSAAGRPIDLHNLASRVICPALAKCSTCEREKHEVNGHEYKPIIEWRGFYALRRGCATLATSLDSALAAKSLLRHANISTTDQFYIKSVDADAVRAMQKIDTLFARGDGPAN